MDGPDDTDILMSAGAPAEYTNKVSTTLKYVLLAFTMFFWIVGSIFVAVGGYSVSQKTGYEELSDFATDPGIILCFLGCLIFLVSSFGVLGSLRENIFLLNAYKILLCLVLVFEICCGILGFAFWPEMKKMIDYNLDAGIKHYTLNTDLRNMIDTVQRELECCGSLSIDDWDSNPYFSCKNVESYRSCGVPWSCCLRKYEKNRQCGYGVRKNRVHVKLSNEIYTVGCLDKGFEFFKEHFFLIGILTIVFSFPLLFGMIMAHVLGSQITEQLQRVDKQKVFL